MAEHPRFFPHPNVASHRRCDRQVQRPTAFVRRHSLLWLLATAGAALFSTVRADPLRCDVRAYRGSPGLTTAVEQDVLTVTWLGAAGTELRARYAIERAQPIVRNCVAGGGAWVVR